MHQCCHEWLERGVCCVRYKYEMEYMQLLYIKLRHHQYEASHTHYTAEQLPCSFRCSRSQAETAHLRDDCISKSQIETLLGSC